jgi:hypothetical protein
VNALMDGVPTKSVITSNSIHSQYHSYLTEKLDGNEFYSESTVSLLSLILLVCITLSTVSEVLLPKSLASE